MSELVKLGDYVDVLTGYPFKSSGYIENPNGVRLLRGDNIGQGRIRWDNAKLWPADEFNVHKQYQLQAGDVVLAMDRPWIEAGLKCAEIRADDVPSLLVQRVARLRALPGLDQRYLAYLIRSPRFTDYVLGVQTGTAVPHISAAQIRDFEFCLPPLRTQQAIAAVLGALDDKIAVNERIAGVAEQLAAALASHTMWDTTTPLREIVDQTRDQVIPESINAKLIAHYSLPSFDASRLPETVEPWRIKSGKFQVVGAAVLLSKLNPSIPRVWNVDPSPSMPALASTEFLVLKPKAGITTHEVWAVCSQPEFFEELVGKATGTSNSHQRVRPADILSTEVVDPRSMTDVVRGQIASLSRKAMRVRVESQVLAQLRDTLLPKLISGELRVRDAEKAVEEAL